MQSNLSVLLLSFLIIELLIIVPCLASPLKSRERDESRANMARRLRAPMLGRALLSVSSDFDGFEASNQESDLSSQSDEDHAALMDKRRPNVPLFGRRWIPVKRRGPLFG